LQLTDDIRRMPIAAIHQYLADESYWAKGIPIKTLTRAIQNSICICALDGEQLMGFARAVTDRATFAYLADVFVLADYRGRGVAKAIIAALHAHTDLQGLRRWLLVTRDAHGLYQPFGFSEIATPSRFMERRDPNVYQAPAPPK